MRRRRHAPHQIRYPETGFAEIHTSSAESADTDYKPTSGPPGSRGSASGLVVIHPTRLANAQQVGTGPQLFPFSDVGLAHLP